MWTTVTWQPARPTHKIKTQFSPLIPAGTTGYIKNAGETESDGEALLVEEQYPYLFFPSAENDLTAETRAATSRGVLVKETEVEKIA